MTKPQRAAMGLRAHSGWAALVVVAGPSRSPSVIDRRQVELISPGIPKQPYHAAEKLTLKAAEKLVERCADTASRLAQQALHAVRSEAQDKGYDVAGCGLLLGSGRSLTSLAATLASHALIHTAEGELFRDALARASERCGMPVVGVRDREVYERGAADLRIKMDKLNQHLSEMGRAVGPPWTQDQKRAAVAAWLVLASSARV
jgi:hypothetical protein